MPKPTNQPPIQPPPGTRFLRQVLWLRPCECPKLVVSVPARKRGTSRRVHRLLPAQWPSDAHQIGLLQLPVLPTADPELRPGHSDPHQGESGKGQGAKDAQTSGGRLIN